MKNGAPNAVGLVLLTVFFGLLIMIVAVLGKLGELWWFPDEAIAVVLLVVLAGALVIGVLAAFTKWGRES